MPSISSCNEKYHGKGIMGVATIIWSPSASNLTLEMDADSDFAIYQQARAEYARLRKH
jgi:hypothetical protein